MKTILKRIVVGAVGGTITVIGVVALVTPGPGWLIIFAGLGILATEFAWAAMFLENAKKSARKAANKAKFKGKNREIYLAIFFASVLAILLVWHAYFR
jgi:uncharacterized protein (TIGR02611 family)